MQGIQVGGVRLPLVELTEEERNVVMRLLPTKEFATV